MIRMSLIFSLFLFSVTVYAHAPCGSGVGAFHGGVGINRCGSPYGCVNGRPAVQPGRIILPPAPPTTIIIQRR